MTEDYKIDTFIASGSTLNLVLGLDCDSEENNTLFECWNNSGNRIRGIIHTTSAESNYEKGHLMFDIGDKITASDLERIKRHSTPSESMKNNFFTG